ncbi:MAG: photosystem II stability/assembly factor-like uncharacterized protein [Saprospiraceae bacterium]|jgi:photosystem II stability/assembly factor-like uncharacterized protein
MKLHKYYFLLFIAMGLVACNQETTPKKMSKDKRIALMAEQEIEMTKDPVTGEVPKDKIYEIKRQLIKEGRYDVSREGEDWKSRGPNNVGGRTRAVLVDSRDPSGNSLIIGSVGGGLWTVKNADTDPTWERVVGYTGNPSVCSIVQDPNNPENMYIGTGEGWFNGDAYRGDGIYKSTNGGIDWDRLSSTSNGDFNHTQKLIFTADGNLLAATRESGVQMSTNGGQTWAAVLSNTNQGFSNRAADLEMTSDGTIFASMGIFTTDGVYKSVDGGFQWSFLELGVDHYQRIELGTSLNDPNLVMALVQNDSTRSVNNILRSTDKGETWNKVTVALTFGGGNFTRGQAWYDLSIAIDPNNSDVAFIGGINVYKTEDGGNTWAQMSEWFQTPQIQNVHADQHSAQFVNGSSDRVMFSNDGGLYITQDATSPLPEIRGISEGYVSTQFYACAIHPEAGRDFFLAGAQDNGTNQLTTPGLGGAIEVIGGDGAICHIGQNNGNFQVGASQGLGFRASFAGDLSTGGFYSTQDTLSYFINPTELDDINLVVYSSGNVGHVSRTFLVNQQSEPIPIPGLEGQRVSALKMDPHDSNILYLGSNSGRIFKVTNPTSDNPQTVTLYNGGGFTRNIEVDHIDRNKLLVTYSNFGVESIATSNDRGESWRSLEGDLPDVPVRWGIFNPRDNNKVLIATEIGIWQANINETPTSWENISPQIGLGRVDMLKFRASDLEVAAATYGRGLWTTSSFSEPGIKFNNQYLSVNPNGISDGQFCNPIEKTSISIGTALAYDKDVDVTITVESSSTAIEGLDFVLAETSTTLLEGETTVEIELIVFDNATIEGDKTINLTLTSDEEVLSNTMKIDLIDNDSEFKTEGTNLQTYIGDGEEVLDNSIFNGAWEGTRTQILYKQEFLAEYGVGGQVINRLVFDVEEKLSEIPYDGFNISMALVGNDTLSLGGFKEDANMINVFSGTLDTKQGVNIIKLDSPFLYDGTSNLLVEICYDNDETTDADFMFSTATSYVSALRVVSDGEAGCPSEGDLEVLYSVPNVRFRSGIPVGVYNTPGRDFSSSIEPDLTAYFASNDSIMCAVKNESMTEEVCFSTSLATASGELIAENEMRWINKIYDMSSDSEDDQVITIYYSTIGSDAWFDDDIEGLYQPTFGEGIPIDWQAVELTLIEERDDYIAFTMPYLGEGFYTVGEESFSLSNTNTELDIIYDAVKIFDLSGRIISHSNQIRNDVPTGIYIKSFLRNGAVVKSEKMFVE